MAYYILPWLLIFYLGVTQGLNDQCCNEQCETVGTVLDCNNKCKTGKLCAINNNIIHLSFNNNRLGKRPNFLFPYQENIKKLSLNYNDLTTGIPETLFSSFRELKVLELYGNDFDAATFLATTEHKKIVKILGLRTTCLHNLQKFPHLRELEITVLSNDICDNILKSNVTKLSLTLENINYLDGTKFQNLQNTKYVALTIPKITHLQEDNFKYFSEVNILEINANQLAVIAPLAFKYLTNLKRLIIRAPYLRTFSNELLHYRINDITSKLEYVEFCPISNLPDRLLVGQNTIKNVKLCRLEDIAYIGIPSEIEYNQISLSDSRYNSRGGDIKSLTLYVLVDSRPMIDKTIKINSSKVDLINMTLYNFDWSMSFHRHVIKYLNLHGNFLTQISYECLSGFEELLNLDLSNNNINFISYTAFRDLVKLRYLDLSDNSLESIDFSMFNTRQLHFTDFSNNKISELKPDIRGLSVQKLSLRNNSLSDIDAFMKEQINVKEISLYNNNIARFPSFLSSSLRKIDFRNNPINCDCQFVTHVYKLTQDLIENDQLGIVNSLDYLICQSNTSNGMTVLEASKECINVTNRMLDFEFEVKNSSANDHFYPALGTMLKQKGVIVSSNDLVISNIIITLPRIRLPYLLSLDKIIEICEKEEEIDNVFCKVHLPEVKERLAESLRLRDKIKDKLIDMYRITFDSYDYQPTRNRRFILTGLSAISSIAFNVYKVYSEAVVRRRISSMEKSFSIVKSDILQNSDKILAISKDLAMYKAINKHNIDIILKHISKLQDTIKKAADIFNTQFRETPYTYTTINRMQRYMRENFMKERLFRTIEKHVSYYKDAMLEVDQLIDGIIQLKKGLLPAKLVSPTQLKNIITKAEELIAKERPDFKLVFSELDDFYRLNNIGFSTDIKLGIIVQIPIFITLKKLDFLNLFEFHSLPLPLNDQMTKLVTKHKFFAAHENLYKSFNKEEFEMCEEHTNQNLYICPFDLMMTDRQVASCESLIYYNENLNEIYKKCDIVLYPNDVEHTPEIYHFDEKILLSHVHPPITWHCDNGISTKDELHINLNYTIISRDALCGCELRTNEFLIPKRSCLTNKETAKLHFVVNALATLGLESFIEEHYTSDFLLQLHDYQPNISLPVINFDNLGMEEELFQAQDDMSLNFKDVVDIMNNDKKSRANEMLSIKQLFYGKYGIIGYISILATLGSVGLILVIWLCKRQFHLKRLLYALISQFVPLVESKNSDDLIYIKTWNEYVINFFTMFVTMIFMQILYMITKKILFKIRNAVPKLQIPKVLEDSSQSVLYLVLRSQDTKINIPLCKILAQSDLVGLDNSLGVDNLIVERHCLKHKLIIEWSVENQNIFINSMTVRLPSTIAINAFTAKKIRRIKEENILISLILIDDNNIAFKLGSQLYTPLDIEVVHFDNRKTAASLSLKEKKQLLLKS